MCWECWECFPCHRLQSKPQVSDLGMHHGTCVMHVPWCMSGLLTCGGWENIPSISAACATPNYTYLVRNPLLMVPTRGNRTPPPSPTPTQALPHPHHSLFICFQNYHGLHSNRKCVCSSCKNITQNLTKKNEIFSGNTRFPHICSIKKRFTI